MTRKPSHRMSPRMSTSLSLRDAEIHADPRFSYVPSKRPTVWYPIEPWQKPADRPKQ